MCGLCCIRVERPNYSRGLGVNGPDLASLPGIGDNNEQPVLRIAAGGRRNRGFENLRNQFVGYWIGFETAQGARRMDHFKDISRAHCGLRVAESLDRRLANSLVAKFTSGPSRVNLCDTGYFLLGS